MCGICGYVGHRGPELLTAMCGRMMHRGPDAEGFWSDERAGVGLGHRRLSILDLSPAGRQPMTNETGTVWLVFNGEIYNYAELRRQLEARGHRFRSRTDTEVLVHLYEDEGEAMLDRLDGMFAFAVWDAERRRLFAARDHVGIKPFYYCEQGGGFYFASEIKALLAIPGIPRQLNPHAVDELLTYLWVMDPNTMLEGIQKLPPGHWLIYADGQLHVRRWYQVRYGADEGQRSASEWAQRVREQLLESTTRQLMSDVPLGAFLSGGLDSSAIAACMREQAPCRPISCFGIGVRPEDAGPDHFEDDLPFARQVADQLGLQLREHVLAPEDVRLLPRMVYHLDEPLADPAAVCCYLVCRRAREEGIKVLLSGAGGDEVFFGYRMHQAMRLLGLTDRLPWNPAPAVLEALARSASWTGKAGCATPRRLARLAWAGRARGHERLRRLADWSSPFERQRLYRPEFAARLSRDAAGDTHRQHYDEFLGTGELNRVSHVLTQTFLPALNLTYADKASMACGVEVRVPFLSRGVVELGARIPETLKLRGLTTKYVLREAFAGRLPETVLRRGKTGFLAPLRRWISRELDEVIRELLDPQVLRWRGIFCAEAVAQVLREQRQGTHDHAYLIWSLLTLELWMRTFIDRPGERLPDLVLARPPGLPVAGSSASPRFSRRQRAAARENRKPSQVAGRGALERAGRESQAREHA